MVRAPCGIFLLQDHFVRSEVADVTGIVKYVRKRVFWHQHPPQKKLSWGGGGATDPLAPLYSAAYEKIYIRGENPLCRNPGL